MDLNEFIIKSFNFLHPGKQLVKNWHIDAMIACLQSAEKGEMRRILINLPPRSLKSFCISVTWPAWLLAQNPANKVIVVSYSNVLSTKHSQETRSIIRSSWFADLYPDTKIMRGQDTKQKFVTTQYGFSFATSTHATLLGEGADYIIVDDPQTPSEAESKTQAEQTCNWYEDTLSSRLNDMRSGVIVVVGHRIGKQDLSNYLLKKKIFFHLCLSMIQETKDKMIKIGDFEYLRCKGNILNPMYDADVIQEIKHNVGQRQFLIQYQQQPDATKSQCFQPEWIRYYDQLPNEALQFYQSWDCAAKIGVHNDYSVCTTWALDPITNYIYLVDVFRDKLLFSDLWAKAQQLYIKYMPSKVLIEDASVGQALHNVIFNIGIPSLAIKPLQSKLQRAFVITPMLEQGRVLHLKNAAWLRDYENEILNFPDTLHDDQVDSAVQFLNWIKNQTVKSTSSLPVIKVC